MQSKKHSIIEATVNVLSGMIIAFIISQLFHEYQAEVQKYIWSGFEWNITAGSNVVMTVVLTIVSVIRGYIWRRYFNKKSKGLLEDHYLNRG